MARTLAVFLSVAFLIGSAHPAAADERTLEDASVPTSLRHRPHG